MIAGLKQTANQLGLPFGERTMTYNSRLAQELGLWAEELGHGESFHHAAFRAYFVDGSNLADLSILLKLAVSVGLPVEEARHILQTRSYGAKVDMHWQESRQLGINAVPTFIIGLNRLVGAQSYQALEELVQMAGVKKKNC